MQLLNAYDDDSNRKCLQRIDRRVIATEEVNKVLYKQMQFSAKPSDDYSHPSPEAIESYALASVRGSLDPDNPDVIKLEEHLLWCNHCLTSVETEEAVALRIADELNALKARAQRVSKPKVMHAGNRLFF